MKLENHTESFESFKKLLDKLVFKDEHKSIPALIDYWLEPMDEVYNILINVSCNGKSFDEFKQELKQSSRNIEFELNNKSNSIMTVLKQIDYLKEDLFDLEGRYTGNVENSIAPHIEKLKFEYEEDHTEFFHLIQKTSRTDYYDFIKHTINQLQKRILDRITLSKSIGSKVEENVQDRIKWKNSNGMLGYLIYCLDAYQYIQLPTHNGGEIHYPDTAKLILDCFELKREPKSFESFEKALNPNSNGLSTKSRELIDDLLKELESLNN